MGPVGRLCRPPVDSGPSTPELLAGLCLQQLLPGPFACPGLGLLRRKPSSQPCWVCSQCRVSPNDQDHQDVEGGTGDVGWRHRCREVRGGRRDQWEEGEEGTEKPQEERPRHDRPGKETLKSGKVGKRWGGAQHRSGQCGSSSHPFRTGDIFPFCLKKFPSSNSWAGAVAQQRQAGGRGRLGFAPAIPGVAQVEIWVPRPGPPLLSPAPLSSTYPGPHPMIPRPSCTSPLHQGCACSSHAPPAEIGRVHV